MGKEKDNSSSAPSLVEIPLAKKATVSSYDKGYRGVLGNEYASRFLESIHATPTPANVEYVLKQLPVDKALVLPMASRGSIVLVPGYGDKKNVDMATLFGIAPSVSGAAPASVPHDKEAGPGAEDSVPIGSPKKKPGSDQSNNSNGKGEEASGKGVGKGKNSGSGSSSNPITRQGHASKEKGDNKPKQADPTTAGRRVSWCTVYTLDFLNPIVDTLDIDEIANKHFRRLLEPLSISDGDLSLPVEAFNAALVDYVPSLKLDKTSKQFMKLQKFLEGTSCMRLYGLLAHFVYWNIVHPCARRACVNAKLIDPLAFPSRAVLPTSPSKSRAPLDLGQGQTQDPFQIVDEQFNGLVNISDMNINMNQDQGGDLAAAENGCVDMDDPFNAELSESSMFSILDSLATATSLDLEEKEVLFVQLQECYIHLQHTTGSSKQCLATAHQGLICCCHFAVDHVLSMMYPWFSQDRNASMKHVGQANPGAVYELRLQMRRLMHQAISDLVDPSRLYTDAFLNASSVGKEKVPLKSRADGISRQYTCSVLVRALFQQEARDPNTKCMLQLQDKKPYANVPGLRPAGGDGAVDTGKLSGGIAFKPAFRYNETDFPAPVPKHKREHFKSTGDSKGHHKFGGATNTDGGHAWVRPRNRFITSHHGKEGARGPFGRADGVPSMQEDKAHVGEMLRLATVPVNVLKNARGKNSKGKVEVNTRVIALPGGQIRLQRGRERVFESIFDPAEGIPTDQIDARDLFGSYERLRAQREEARREKEAARKEADLSVTFEDSDMAIVGAGMGSRVGYGAVDVYSASAFSSVIHHAGPEQRTEFGRSSNPKPNPTRFIPIAASSKRDLLSLLVRKVQTNYANPDLCLTDRIELLKANKGE